MRLGARAFVLVAIRTSLTNPPETEPGQALNGWFNTEGQAITGAGITIVGSPHLHIGIVIGSWICPTVPWTSPGVTRPNLTISAIPTVRESLGAVLAAAAILVWPPLAWSCHGCFN